MTRVHGSAHSSPGSHPCAGRKIRRPAKNRATRAPPIKRGRYGSSNVRFPIHAPLRPRATRTRGPRQQVEAKMAAKPPTRSAPEPARSDALLTVSTLTCHSRAYACLSLSKLGNERSACAILCCSCLEPDGARASTSEGQQVSAGHGPAFLPIGGAPAHTAASDFLGASRDLGSR